MRQFFLQSLMDEEKIDRLNELSVAVVGSRMLVEILWRCGIGYIKYISDFVSQIDALVDCTINPLEANQYDVVSPKSDESCVISYFYPENKEKLKEILGDTEIIVAHKHVCEISKIAEELKIPFIPDIVTTFIPGGVRFLELEYPRIDRNPISYAITCGLQATEVMKILADKKPILAPEAILVDLKEGIRRVWLKKVGTA
ncbi:MAG: hypothetical protein N3D09_04845 [Archaeoglobaceae archaeon]|nr:hypothetical protein [Archaeoglobaceae archaeon]